MRNFRSLLKNYPLFTWLLSSNECLFPPLVCTGSRRRSSSFAKMLLCSGPVLTKLLNCIFPKTHSNYYKGPSSNFVFKLNIVTFDLEKLEFVFSLLDLSGWNIIAPKWKSVCHSSGVVGGVICLLLVLDPYNTPNYEY